MSGSPASYTLSIDWANAGGYPNNGDATYLRSYSIRRGHRQPFSGDPATGEAKLARDQVGTLTLVLDNSTGRYNSYNDSSALFPNVTPGHVVRLSVTDDLSNTYILFTGIIDDIRSQSYLTDPRVEITCSDAWKRLSQRPIAASFSSWVISPTIGANIYNPMVEILGYAGIPLGSNAVTGYGTTQGSDGYYAMWGENDVPYRVLHDFWEMDGGYCWIGYDGAFYNISRTVALAQTPLFTLDQSQVLNEPQMSQPWDNIVNSVRMNVYDRTRIHDTQVVWRDTKTPLLQPGETLHYRIDFTGSTGRVAPCGGAMSGLKAALYAQLNTAPDATGANLALGITQLYPPGSPASASDGPTININGGGGTCAEFNFTNNSSQAGYLLAVLDDPFAAGTVQGMTLFKAPYDCLNPTEVVTQDSASIAAYGLRELRLDYPYAQNAIVIKAITNAYLARYKDPRPVITVEIINRSTVQFPYDLYSLLNFTSTFLNRHYANGCFDYGFRIIGIEHSSGQTVYEVKTTWTLEPVTNPSGIIPATPGPITTGSYLFGVLTYP